MAKQWAHLLIWYINTATKRGPDITLKVGKMEKSSLQEWKLGETLKTNNANSNVNKIEAECITLLKDKRGCF